VLKRLVVLTLLFTAPCVSCTMCPPAPGGAVAPTPYVIARAAIQGAELGLLVADSLFEGWALAQSDPAKVRARYVQVRTIVADSLRVALDAVNTAEVLSQDFDLAVLLTQAEAAWQDLRKLIEDLASPTTRPSTGPGTRPVTDPMLGAAGKAPGPLLPKTLLPAKKQPAIK
jgi:hypothetical protein